MTSTQKFLLSVSYLHLFLPVEWKELLQQLMGPAQNSTVSSLDMDPPLVQVWKPSKMFLLDMLRGAPTMEPFSLELKGLELNSELNSSTLKCTRRSLCSLNVECLKGSKLALPLLMHPLGHCID
ncbi:hypothetical protein Peur_004025 [Populus x canadensis]